MTKGTRQRKDDGTPLSDSESYKRLIGKLIYLTTTRPDLSYVVQQLSQFMTCPTSLHYAATIRVLRNIKSSPFVGLYFPKD